MRNYLREKQDGQILVIAIIIVLVTFGLVVGSLYNTQVSQKLSADFRGKKSLEYRAEEGVKRTLAEFVRSHPSDGQATTARTENFAPWTGPVTCDSAGKPVLLDEAQGGNLGSIDCVFIQEKGLNVTVVRKPDHCKNGKSLTGGVTSCEPDDSTEARVFLVNSTAYDSAERSRLTQAVIISPRYKLVRLDAGGTTPVGQIIADPYEKPYLASIVRGGEHLRPQATATAKYTEPGQEPTESPTTEPTITPTTAPTTKPTKITTIVEPPALPK